MKVLNKIKKIFLGFICTIFLIFAIFLSVLLLSYNEYGVTQFDDKALILINGHISSNVYKKGDLVITESKELDQIKKGDEIFVYKLDGHGAVNIVVGEVDNIYDEGISLVNGGTYSTKFIAGEAIKTYHKIGLYLSIIESKWGFLFIILVPLFFIFIYQIYALIVEIKYGKDEYYEVDTKKESEEKEEIKKDTFEEKKSEKDLEKKEIDKKKTKKENSN